MRTSKVRIMKFDWNCVESQFAFQILGQSNLFLWWLARQDTRNGKLQLSKMGHSPTMGPFKGTIAHSLDNWFWHLDVNKEKKVKVWDVLYLIVGKLVWRFIEAGAYWLCACLRKSSKENGKTIKFFSSAAIQKRCFTKISKFNISFCQVRKGFFKKGVLVTRNLERDSLPF